MTPIEITPVTGEDPQIHVSGGDGFYDSGVPGCIGDPFVSLPTSAVPGRVGVLDTGVPWIRLAVELDVEYGRLLGHLSAVVGDSPRPPEHLDGADRFVLGVWAAATWTLGHTRTAPATRAERPVTGQVIRDELAAAEQLLDARGRFWEVAAGSLEWLLWITGARQVLSYPGF